MTDIYRVSYESQSIVCLLLWGSLSNPPPSHIKNIHHPGTSFNFCQLKHIQSRILIIRWSFVGDQLSCSSLYLSQCMGPSLWNREYKSWLEQLNFLRRSNILEEAVQPSSPTLLASVATTSLFKSFFYLCSRYNEPANTSRKERGESKMSLILKHHMIKRPTEKNVPFFVKSRLET
jgi:hypothetical protein